MDYSRHMVHGNEWGFGVLMMVFWLIVLAVAAFVVLRYLKEHNYHASQISQTGEVQKLDPLDIVRERYAKGEITKEQFEQLKKDLK